MPSLKVLKSHLESLFRPKRKSFFNIYDPTGTRYLFQLRLGLSPLREHKKRHKFKDTPTELCFCKTGNENIQHFLFKCPFYASHRAALATKVIKILIENSLNHLGNSENLYLYGHQSLSDTENKDILLATLKFIKDSNRFSRWALPLSPLPSPSSSHPLPHPFPILTWCIYSAVLSVSFSVYVCLVSSLQMMAKCRRFSVRQA